MSRECGLVPRSRIYFQFSTMKPSFFRIFTFALAACFWLVGCASAPKKSLYLTNADLRVSAEILYQNLCQSGKLDEVAADFQGGKKPVLSSATLKNACPNAWLHDITSNDRFKECLRNGGHMRILAGDRASVQGEKLNDIINFDNETGSASEDPSAAKSLGDYLLHAAISKADGNAYKIYAEIWDLNAENESIWSASHIIKK